MGVRGYFLDFYSLRNFRIPYYVILGLDPRIPIRNSRFVGILEFPRDKKLIGILDLGILEFLDLRQF